MISLDKTGDIEGEQKCIEEVDDMYFHILSTKRRLAPTDSVLDQTNVGNKPQVKLPKIDLPSFDGKLKEFPHFRDMFNSLIHENDTISNVEKYHYLVTSLRGEPLSLAKTLPITAQNYDVIWGQLKERYDNKRFLATHYLEEILNLPTLHTESSKKLRYVLDLCTENTIALKAMRFPVDYGDFMLMFLILQRLDKHSRQLFERKYSSTEFPTLEQLLNFLKDHTKSLDASSIHDKPQPVQPVFYNRPKPSNLTKPVPPRPYNAYVSSVKGLSCLYCSDTHVIYRCPRFCDLPVSRRHDFIKSKQACFNCLSTGHTLKSCSSTSTCRKCSHRHHTMLHENHSAETAAKPLPTPKPSTSNAVSSTAALTASSSPHLGSTVTSTALLATAAIQIQDSLGNYQTSRALLDPGSQMSFITEECVKRLSLPRTKFNASISGISGSNVQSPKGIVTCVIKPRFRSHPCLQTSAVVLNTITAPLPTSPISPAIKDHFNKLDLADAFFDVPGEIDFLIGADLYPDVCDGGRLKSPVGYPTPFRTIFGWVLLGNTTACIAQDRPKAAPSDTVLSNLSITQAHTLESSIRKFWEIEEPPSKHHVSVEDERAEAIFCQTTTRETSGRYVVNLPFRQDPPDLGESYNHALQSLQRLEIRLSRNSTLKLEYDKFMNEYEALGHMRKIDLSDTKPKYYIPHHGVVKRGSDISKLRVVFNGSAPTSNGQSLNSQLLTGPKLQNDICKIICNFRLFHVVFCADICKMYRQIMVHPNHQEYQAILWRKSPNHPVDCYLLTTVTYGLSSAPYLAIRTLHQLAKDEGHHYPMAANSLLNHTFVDDCMIGSDCVESALKLKAELIELLKLGGFELKKWSSNHPDVLEGIPESCQEVKFQPDCINVDAIKVLGIKWQPITDEFMYKVCLNDFQSHSTTTKRSILSLTSTLFDPLGWVTPVILYAKKLIQILWTLGVGWDDPLDGTILIDWHNFVQELPLLEDIRIPRHVLCFKPNPDSIQLHGFSDGSSEAYGACLYIRSESSCGQVGTELVVAKSKVAPLKTLTIPKLELCGAVLLTKLVDFYKEPLFNKFGQIPIFAWSDSTIVLSWIKTSPHLLKTFVGNRVSMIQDVIEPERWRYVPTNDNPADCASRGILPSQLTDHKLWWTGPPWLVQSPDLWPITALPTTPADNLPETTLPIVTTAAIEQPSTDLKLIENYSSLLRMKRVIGWCFRFINNCRVTKYQRLSGPLTYPELHNSLLTVVKLTQSTYLQEDLSCIKSGKFCRPAVQRLAPFLDEEGILRVGGRLKHTSLQFSSRHPALLPKHCHLTRLLIDHYHTTYLHVGPRQLQSLLQRNFWILSVRSAIRKRISLCVKCTKFKADSPQPFMADLPAARVTPSRPFLKVGTDFGGPFTIKTEKIRKPQMRKAYLCLFVCLCTKAVHLEAVSDLTSEAFLAALDRFVARRGLCTDIYSDQGTNYIGAKSTINEYFTFLHKSDISSKISDALTAKSINWHLNPPSAPHFGGIWEAGIKSTKYHLSRVIGDQVLTFEELSTLFCKIEAILNSRPLCPLSTDPHEMNVLTPGHFLVGEPLLSIPHPDYSHTQTNRLSRWQLIQQIRQHFWRRWSAEYLHTLQERCKWSRRNPSVQEGDIVLIKENNLPPQTWRMAKIISLLPGADGIVRVAKLRTGHGELIRPVIKLCPLPVSE